MSKILPVKLDFNFESECWNFYKLCIINAYEEYDFWFAEKFQELTMFNKYEINYYDTNSLDYISPEFDEVLDIRMFPCKDHVLDKIRTSIEKNQYIILYVDYYYLEGAYCYLKEHKYHEIMINGYRDDVFSVVSINLDGKLWATKQISQSSLKQAFDSGYKWLENDHFMRQLLAEFMYPAVCLEPKKNVKRDIKLTRISGALKRWYFGEYRTVSYIHKPFEGVGSKVYKGLSIYDAYLNDLCDDFKTKGKDVFQDDIMILIGINKLIELKKNLLETVIKLDDCKRLTIDNSTIEDHVKLNQQLTILLRLVEKFAISGSVKTIARIEEILVACKELDTSITGNYIKAFDEAIINEIY